MTSGVYVITCHANESRYIGSSWNVEARLEEHFQELASNTHCNRAMQADFIEYGREMFSAKLIEECRSNRVYVEQHHIDKAQATDARLYNARKARVLTWEASKLGGLKRSKMQRWARPEMTEEEGRQRMSRAAKRTNSLMKERTAAAIEQAYAELEHLGISSPTNEQVAVLAGVSRRTVQRMKAKK